MGSTHVSGAGTELLTACRAEDSGSPLGLTWLDHFGNWRFFRVPHLACACVCVIKWVACEARKDKSIGKDKEEPHPQALNRPLAN